MHLRSRRHRELRSSRSSVGDGPSEASGGRLPSEKALEESAAARCDDPHLGPVKAQVSIHPLTHLQGASNSSLLASFDGPDCGREPDSTSSVGAALAVREQPPISPLPIDVTSPGHDSIDSGMYSDEEAMSDGEQEEEEEEGDYERPEEGFFDGSFPLEDWCISACDVTIDKTLASSAGETVYRYVAIIYIMLSSYSSEYRPI